MGSYTVAIVTDDGKTVFIRITVLDDNSPPYFDKDKYQVTIHSNNRTCIGNLILLSY